MVRVIIHRTPYASIGLLARDLRMGASTRGVSRLKLDEQPPMARRRIKTRYGNPSS
jgi:hypothetical protein